MADGLPRGQYRHLPGIAVTLIFHIAAQDAALAARENGEYRAESLSGEGFIHFSGSHQLLDVARRFYTGQCGLVVLAVDPSLLKAELKYEAPVHPSTRPVGQSGQAPAAAHSVELPKNEALSRDKRLNYSNELINTESLAADLFPHLYGPLNFDAVVAIYDFEPDSTGKFSLPAALTSNI